MKRILVLLALGSLIVFPELLSAQTGGDREINRNVRRSRPEPEYELDAPEPLLEPKLPLIQALPDASREVGLFLNRNLIVEGNVQPPPQNESSIAVSPLDPNFLIASAVDYRGFGNYIYISTDGGRSWTNRDLGNVHDSTWRSGNDPSVTFDYLGNAYKMFGGFTGVAAKNGVYMMKSTDHGATWVLNTVIEHTGPITKDTAFEDKYYIQIDNSAASPFRGRMYTPWKRVIESDSSTQIVVTYSSNGGSVWSTPVRVSPKKSGTSYDTTFGQSFPLTSTGPNGELYVVWNDGIIHSIGFAKSVDGGVSFSAPSYPVQNYPIHGTTRAIIEGSGANKDTTYYHVLKGTFRAETYPTIAVDNSNSPRRGWIYLGYASGKNPDVKVIHSTDAGATWSAPQVVHADPSGDQWWPWIMVDQTNGDVAVVYSDSRDDTANIRVNQYIAYSSDGGATWIDRRATDTTSDFRNNPFADKIFAGDYSGGAFHNGKIYPSALDTRRGNNDVFTELIGLHQPYPVENLRVHSSATNYDEANLTWSNPSQQLSIFGKPYSDYTLVLTRDNQLLVTLPAGTTSYNDGGLTLDQQYVYAVRVAIPGDTSAVRSVKFKAGEARLPASPRITDAHPWKPVADLSVRIPSLRADSLTPLTNLAGYKLYRDGVFIKQGTLNTTDTGSIITVNDIPTERGYYRYSLTVFDASAPLNESLRSDSVTIYVGDLSPYTENFDGAPQHFLVPTGWGLTTSVAFSAPNAFTDSPVGNYKGLRRDYMQIYPVEAAVGQSIDLRFAHIAIVDPSDSAVIEISYDSAKTWSQIASWNWKADPAWSDSSAAAGDWRIWTSRIQGKGIGNPMLVRFGLRTSLAVHADGWYLDNIEFGTASGVNERPGATGVTLSIYPNPAHGIVGINYELAEPGTVQLRITDAMGRTVQQLQNGIMESGPHATTFRTETAGVYFYELRTKSGVVRGKVVVY